MTATPKIDFPFQSHKLREATQSFVKEAAGGNPEAAASVISALKVANKSDAKDIFTGDDLAFLVQARSEFLKFQEKRAQLGPAGQLYVVQSNLRQLALKLPKIAAEKPEKVARTQDEIESYQQAAVELAKSVAALIEARDNTLETLHALDVDPDRVVAEFIEELETVNAITNDQIAKLEGAGAEIPAEMREELASREATLASVKSGGKEAVRQTLMKSLEDMKEMGIPDTAPQVGEPLSFNPWERLSEFMEQKLAERKKLPNADDLIAQLFSEAKVKSPEQTKAPQKPTLSSIGGESPSEVEKMFNDALAKTGANALLYPVEQVRVTAAQEFVERMYNIPTVRDIIFPAVERMIVGWEMQHRAEQAQIGRNTILIKNPKPGSPERPTPPELWSPMESAAFDALQEMAKLQGFPNEVPLVFEDASGSNAYVYTFRKEEARVTFMRPLLEKCWDFESNDWVKVWIDAEGKAVPQGTEGATLEPVGKYLFQSVVGHELGHISDGVMKYRTAAVMLLEMTGVDLTLPNITQHAIHGSACGCAMIEAKAQKYLLDNMAREDIKLSPATAERTLRALFSEALPDLPIDLPAEAVARRLGMSKAELDAARALVPAQADEARRDRLVGFVLRLRYLNQNFETTADRHAILAQGTAKWTQVVDYLLNTNAFKGEQNSTKAIASLMDGKDEADVWARHKLQSGAGYSVDDVQRTGQFLTHPPGPQRVANAGDYAKYDPFFKGVEELKALPLETRMLAMVQLAEATIDAKLVEAESIKTWDAFDTVQAHAQKNRLQLEAAELEKRYAPLFELVTKLVAQEGPDAPQGSFIDVVLDFVEAGGTDFSSANSDSEESLMVGDVIKKSEKPADTRGQFTRLLTAIEAACAACVATGDAPADSEMISKRLARIRISKEKALEAVQNQVETRKELKDTIRMARKRNAMFA